MFETGNRKRKVNFKNSRGDTNLEYWGKLWFNPKLRGSSGGIVHNHHQAYQPFWLEIVLRWWSPKLKSYQMSLRVSLKHASMRASLPIGRAHLELIFLSREQYKNSPPVLFLPFSKLLYFTEAPSTLCD